ncbi:EamA family transporter [Actinophytocola oryzae]|uniref:EamA-like transporter family protein n=1 Tax=Actinophytocola oryzae TaxID=502181 RepID=A0A4R7USS2_9PSEU|nr:EamA family transporter [Actinophytocola oryzae]TDV38595.1 EamA-like transporter family protein [Actinophytocola oryzae]
MVVVVFAALAAAGWGTADYLGGKASRHAPATAVLLFSQVLALPVLVGWLVVTSPPGPQWSGFAWGAMGGACGFIGMVLFLKSLASGAMTLVAPVVAVAVAVVPFVLGLFMDVWPSGLALGGVCCAVLAIALVNRGGGRVRFSLPAFWTALAAGCGLGMQLVCVGGPAANAGLWPLVGARTTSILCAAVAVLAARQGGLRAVPWGLVVVAGVLDTSGFAFYLFALGSGLLSVVGPLTALAPAATIVLALIVDRERVARTQLAGLGLAAGALVLVAV